MDIGKTEACGAPRAPGIAPAVASARRGSYAEAIRQRHSLPFSAMRLDAARQTPAGYWLTAAEYLLAGRTVQAASRNLMFPALQMYGQSIELALKAFLLKRGVTLEQVEEKHHRLSEILQLARRRRIAT